MTGVQYETIDELRKSVGKDVYDRVRELDALCLVHVYMESFSRLKYCIKCVVCVDDIKLKVVCNEFGEIIRVKFLEEN